MSTRPLLPPTPLAWVLFALGGLALLFAVAMHWRMWQVELGLKPVAAGGGEYLVALLVGVPALLVALLLLGVSAARPRWSSFASRAALAAAAVPAAAWLALVVLDAA